MRGAGLTFAEEHIPESELDWSFDPSGGPGGQHANRTATRVTLRFDVEGSGALPDGTRRHLLDRLAERLSDGVVSVTVDETRSQWRNRAIARRRLAELLERASLPERTRHRTKPTASSHRRRLDAKRRRGEIKRLRKPPKPEG